MKNNYLAVSLDLDGTLLKQKEMIGEKTTKILKYIHSKGIKIIVSTGRSFIGVPQCIKKLNVVDYYILSNGASCCNKDGKVLFTINIDNDLICNLIKPNKKIYFEFLINSKWFVDTDSSTQITEIIDDKSVLEYILSTRIRKKNLINKIKNESLPVEKINFNFSKDNKDFVIKYIKNIVKESNGRLRYWSDKPHKIDLYNNNATKGKSLKKLLAYINISLNNVIGFGDDDNDLDLLENVGLSIAMGNANDSVKSICDIITLSNNDEGVAKVLEKIF